MSTIVLFSALPATTTKNIRIITIATTTKNIHITITVVKGTQPLLPTGGSFPSQLDNSHAFDYHRTTTE
jgi:hypothetical protein